MLIATDSTHKRKSRKIYFKLQWPSQYRHDTIIKWLKSQWKEPTDQISQEIG
jgi:hypothetical protein